MYRIHRWSRRTYLTIFILIYCTIKHRRESRPDFFGNGVGHSAKIFRYAAVIYHSIALVACLVNPTSNPSVRHVRQQRTFAHRVCKSGAKFKAITHRVQDTIHVQVCAPAVYAVIAPHQCTLYSQFTVQMHSLVQLALTACIVSELTGKCTYSVH